jgi:hypothetical protein
MCVTGILINPGLHNLRELNPLEPNAALSIANYRMREIVSDN